MRTTTTIAIVLIGLIILCTSPLTAEGEAARPQKILLITGENNHNWQMTTPQLRKILDDAGYKVVVSEEPAVLETSALAGYAGILMNYNRSERWPESTEQALLGLVRGGTGLIIVHAANNAFPGWDEYDRMVGLTWREGAGHDRFGPMRVRVTDPDHPVSQGLEDFDTTDELYHSLTRASDFRVLAVAHSKNLDADAPMILVRDYGQGRVFHTTLGHNLKAMQTDGFAEVLRRGTDWVVGKEKGKR